MSASKNEGASANSHGLGTEEGSSFSAIMAKSASLGWDSALGFWEWGFNSNHFWDWKGILWTATIAAKATIERGVPGRHVTRFEPILSLACLVPGVPNPFPQPSALTFMPVIAFRFGHKLAHGSLYSGEGLQPVIAANLQNLNHRRCVWHVQTPLLLACHFHYLTTAWYGSPRPAFTKSVSGTTKHLRMWKVKQHTFLSWDRPAAVPRPFVWKQMLSFWEVAISFYSVSNLK